MKRIWLVLLAGLALLLPAAVLAGTAEDSFDRVIGALEQRYQAHATRVPFMGLVSLIANKATDKGVGAMHVAELDDLKQPVDGEELNKLVAEKLGAGWERIIRETHRGGGNQTLIFVHPEGDRMGMFIVDLDGHELDVVEISVDPKHLNEKIGHYSHQEEHDSGTMD